MIGDISWLLVLSFIAAGVGGGFIAGLFGVGGGIIMVPIFYAFFHSEQLYGDFAIQAAVATSLAVMVITSLSSAQFHYRRGAVDLSLVTYWAIPIVVGSVTGSWLATRMPAQELALLFGIFMSGIGLRMNINKTMPKAFWGNNTTNFFKTHLAFRYLPPYLVGCISSMLGVGGGSMTVPILSAFGYPIVRAVGTSATLGFFIAVPATITFGGSSYDIFQGVGTWHIGFVDLIGLLIVGPISVLVAPIGAKVAHSLKSNTLKRVFGFVLFLIGVRMILTTLF